MTKWDKEYLKLCKKILQEGKEIKNRTGINSIKIPAYYLEFDLSDEFPVLTTKKLFFRQAILEMLWIYQVQSNDVRWLQERGVHIWDEWEINENGKWNATQQLNGTLQHIEKDFGVEYSHTIGTAYGYIVNKFKLTNNLIDTIKNNPEVKDFFEFDNSQELKDIKILNYKSHGTIKFPIAQ